MSRWVEQFKSHPFNADWELLSEVLSASLPDRGDVAPGVAQEHARLRKVIEYVRGVVDNLDPELLNPNYLGNLHSYVQQMVNEINAFLSNGNVAHLQNANSHADQLLTVSCQSPFAAFGSVKGNLTKAAIQYADTMDQHAISYANRTDQLLAVSTERLTQLAESMTSANNEVAKLDGRLATVETTVQGQLSTFNSTFQGSEISRAEKYDTWLGKFQEKVDGQFVEMAKKSGMALKVLEDFQSQAEKVLGTVIDTAQAGAYAKYATEERDNANLYRRAAIVLMVLAALVLFLPELTHALQAAITYTVDWQKALTRLPLSLILFAPALYLAKESNKHRINEVSNRRRQHILTTIGPYLALLDEKKADEIKAEVAKNLFTDSSSLEDKSADASNVLAQLSNLATLITKSK